MSTGGGSDLFEGSNGMIGLGMPTESANPSTDVTISAPTSPTAALAAGKGYARKKRLLLILLGVHIILSLFAVAPGHLSVDEGVYHMMSESFATNGSLAIWNGYEEFPSPELALLVARPVNGQLFPQYPHVYTFLAAPFYAVMGYRGLFLLNAIAFVGVAWLTYLLAIRLFRDRDLGLNAVLILALATFAWEYSQAAWPHSTSMLFVMAAVYLAVLAVESPALPFSLVFAGLSGLIAGLGAGVRVDEFFVVPAIAVWFLFLRPVRWREAAGQCIGTLLGLVPLAFLNHIKFGVWSPFSYGKPDEGATAEAGLVAYIPLAAAGLLLLLIVWCSTMLPKTRWLGTPLARFTIGALTLGFVVALVPQAQDLVHKLMNGAFQLLVDLRIRDRNILEGGLSRGSTGGMIYLGSLKKSLLQSAPYLVILLPLLLRLGRGPGEGHRLLLPFLIVAAYVATLSYFAWHGGLCLNLRYFLPILPFTSLLTAIAIREYRLVEGRRGFLLSALVLAVVATHLLATLPQPINIAWQEHLFLTVPLVIAGILLLLTVFVAVRRPATHPRFQALTLAITITAFAWSAMTAFTYDYPRSYYERKSEVEFVERAARTIRPDSILFGADRRIDGFLGLNAKDRIRLALPAVDNYRDFRRLIEFHLTAGRSVYLLLNPAFSRVLEKRDLLGSLNTTKVLDDSRNTIVQVTDRTSTREND